MASGKDQTVSLPAQGDTAARGVSQQHPQSICE